MFYKGVASGSFHTNHDLRVTGLSPRDPAGTLETHRLMAHVCHGTTTSPLISITRSYGVAQDYALSGLVPPSASSPGYVYEVWLESPLPPGVALVDPIQQVMKTYGDPLDRYSYHHDGDQTFLSALSDPVVFRSLLVCPVKRPPSSVATLRATHITTELETFVRSLRDAELLVAGYIPAKCFVARYEISAASISTIDLTKELDAIGSLRFLRAEWWPESPRFALLRYTIDGVESRTGIRLDLDKRTILDSVGDSKLDFAIQQNILEIWNIVGREKLMLATS
jgi:hypothetical protein